jgi:predicted DNA-binding transcriptional regulator AlpA
MHARSSGSECVLAYQARLSIAAPAAEGDMHMPVRSTHPRATDAAPSVQYPLLTAEQVMQMLSISRTSLWILMRQQGLPYIKLGEGRRAALRFTSDSLSRLFATLEQQRLSA